MITITKSAAQQIQESAKGSAAESLVLRIAAERNQDGSIRYLMGFDERRPDDLEITAEGVDVVIPPDAKPLLMGVVLDFVEIEPNNRQFIFLNPNDPTYIPPKE